MEMLNAIQQENFDFLITSDKNLQYQQNLDKYDFRFKILSVENNNYETIFPLVDKIRKALNDNTDKIIIISK